MSDEKAFSGSILRVFEARARQGCADSLVKKFAITSVDVSLETNREIKDTSSARAFQTKMMSFYSFLCGAI
jgi:hypothetical protein